MMRGFVSHYRGGSMDRQRLLMLKILMLTLLVPIILFISWNLNSINSNKEKLSRLGNENISLASVQTGYIDLSKEHEQSQQNYDKLASSLFSEDEIKFYEFCDLVIDAAKNRRVTVSNYSTNESSDPKRINISADGEIRSILEYLQFLYNYKKKIDVDQVSLSYNSAKNIYNLSLMINFVTVQSFTKENP